MPQRTRQIAAWLGNCPASPIILGAAFWFLLARYCSEWNTLITDIAEAESILANGGWFLDKTNAFPTPPTPSATIGLALLAFLYAGKWHIRNHTASRITAVLWYLALLNVAAVYCYLRWEDWENPHVTIMGNWLGTPIMFLAIPTVSFTFDLFTSPRTLRFYVARSTIEILVMPIWLWVWCIVSMVFGLMWL